MLLEMLRRKETIDYVVFFDSGWEFPQMLRHIEKVKKVVESYGIEFITLRPDKPFDYYMFDIQKKNNPVKGYSWCGYGGCRWGTRIKVDTIHRYFRNLPTHIHCIGIAADETERLQREKRDNVRFPLAEYGITEAECLQGCYDAGYDWEGLYEDLDRVSCRFCGMKNLKELRNIYWKMPDVWNELRDYQSRTYLPYRGKYGSIFDLEKRFELEREFESNGKKLRTKEFYDRLRQ